MPGTVLNVCPCPTSQGFVALGGLVGMGPGPHHKCLVHGSGHCGAPKFTGHLTSLGDIFFSTFYFEIILGSRRSYKIVQRVPLYPAPHPHS